MDGFLTKKRMVIGLIQQVRHIMKVNELKALFEKNGVFQNLMPPTMKSSYHPPPRTGPPQPPQPTEILQSQVPSPPPPIQQIKPATRRNNDFLNELNKKLMNKSGREKVIEGLNQQQEPILTLPRNTNIEVSPSTPPRRSQIEYAVPNPPIVEEELSFDDILGNAEKKAVFRSGIRARLGIYERNPSTKEEEEMFSQWENQRQSQLASQIKPNEIKQKEETTKSASSNRATKMKAGIFQTNPHYSKLFKIDKVTRIDRILNSIFNGKPRVVISSQEEQPKTPQSMPVIVKMEAPRIQPEIKKELIVEEKKIQDAPIVFPQETQSNSQPIPTRNMFAMSKEMLSEINMKIKRRNDLINHEQTQNPSEAGKNERSVSPFTKRKRNMQKFDDS